MVLTTNFLTQARTDIKDDIDNLFTDGAIGSSGTTPVASGTALIAEVFRDTRDEFDKTTQVDKITSSLRVLAGEANSNTIREVGWFGQSSAGTAWIRSVINEITKTSDIQLFLDSQITITTEEV